MNLKDNCKTVTRNDLSVMYYGGVSLVYTCYEEQPTDIEDLVVMGESNGSYVDLLVKTPIDYSDSQFDTSIPFSFESQRDFEQFLKTPYDPLNRGFYPLQDRLDRGQLIDCSMYIGIQLRVMLDKFLIEQCSHLISFGPDLSRELYRYFIRTLDKSHKLDEFIKINKTTVLNYNDVNIRVSLYEDEFGELLVFEPCNLDMLNSVKAELYIDDQSEDVIVTINGKVFDKLRCEKESNVYQSSYNDILIDNEMFIRGWRDLITFVMETSPGESYSVEVSKKINQSKFMRTLEIPDNFILIETRYLDTETIDELSYLDYDEYCLGGLK